MEQFKLIQIPARTLTVPFSKVSADNTPENRYERVPPQLRKFVFKPGNKGGPGRPKGKSMKEYSREYLESMTEEERADFLNEIDKSLIWKMAEGNPHQGSSLGVDVNKESLATLTDFFRGIANKK